MRPGGRRRPARSHTRQGAQLVGLLGPVRVVLCPLCGDSFAERLSPADRLRRVVTIGHLFQWIVEAAMSPPMRCGLNANTGLRMEHKALWVDDPDESPELFRRGGSKVLGYTVSMLWARMGLGGRGQQVASAAERFGWMSTSGPVIGL
jgi:hypothetical protein